MSLPKIQIIELDKAHREVYRPPPELTVSQWADAYRRLSAEASAEPGRWNTDRAAYQRGIMDALNARDVEQIVVMSSAQVGKTEILLNIVGYYVHQDPSPMLLLQPTLDMAEAFSKDRLAPMVRDTPALRGKIKDPRARDTGNTLLHKQFPGGHITMAGANSPASLASRPIRVVLCDEVDRYPASAAAEGDPVNLARKRTATFHNRKIILTSTPTVKHFSRIELAYDQSDKRKYFVPCPHCGHEQCLQWDQVKWPDTDPEHAAIHCVKCGEPWTEAQRQAAISKGKWIASAPFKGIAGFHLSELYSPWSTPAVIAKAFLEAKAGGPELLKTWVNTSLGDTWEEESEGVAPHILESRREKWDVAPAAVQVVTVGVDVQQDRLELEIVGWGYGEESWSLDYQVLIGDPVQDDVWQDLAEVLSDRIPTVDGRELTPVAAVIDSGYLPKRVYAFCRGRHQCYPGKGISGAGRPIVETGRKRMMRIARGKRSGDIKPEALGVDEAKSVLYRRLSISAPGPGYCHFPHARDTEYFLQLTAERRVLRYKKGVPYPEWISARPRNEALDCRVYAYAALLLSGVTIHASIPKKKMPAPSPAAAPPEKQQAPAPAATKAQTPRPQPRKSFVQGWRR